MGILAIALAGCGASATMLAATAEVPTATPAGAAPAAGRADLVLTDARIYTAAGPALAAALAVRHGLLVYVGDAAGVKPFIGWRTAVRYMGGRLVVPGLVDSHIHPLDILDFDVCDLRSEARSLRELAAFVGACVRRLGPRRGELLAVHQWNPTSGNQPDADYPNLRVTLDQASPRNPVELLGNDGHHFAFNSAALALARNRAGKTVGFTRATLAADFSEFHRYVGTDEHGEPNGEANEEAQAAIDPGRAVYLELDRVAKVPERIPARLNSAGITAVLDAQVAPEGLVVYDRLLRRNQLTVRAALALYFDPAHTRTPDGHVDYDGMVARAQALRARYAGNPLVRADFVKLFADGTLEGNPFSVPPLAGNAAVLEPYLQPVFAIDADRHATVTAYVDTASHVCIAARAHPEHYRVDAARTAFVAVNGFEPEQCQISNGRLQYDREILLEYARRMHLAGFSLHIHAIGDRGVRTAVDAIEAARAADGVTTTRDSLAHVQLAHPDDVVRIGRDRLYVSYTYSWASTDLDYDMTIIPFLQKVSGNSYASRHPAGSYYEANTYPCRSSKEAGAILAAGSDAPVWRTDPQPFVNMAMAVTRRYPGQPSLNPRQALTIREALDSYTIDGARFLGREREFGSLEPGKSADFVVLDRDILALADGGKPDEIEATRVLETWFRGRRVYRAPGR